MKIETSWRSFILALLLSLGFAVSWPLALGAQPAMLGDRSTGNSSSQYVFLSPPPVLTLPAGTLIAVQSLEILSSDQQHPGDTFVAELRRPLVVDGWVVARLGQTVVGRTSDSNKAGRVKGTSNISLVLEQIFLVNGHQSSVETEPVGRAGPKSRGRDLTTVVITTGAGAAIGSICGAKGAAIGAAAGATAGITGVLLTRGEKVEIEPEELLTFRLSSPLLVSTTEGQHAFWPVEPGDYALPVLVSAPAQIQPAITVISQPAPVQTSPSFLSVIQKLAVSRPGHLNCGE